MKLHHSISHLTGKEQTDLQIITNRLVDALSPEMIFCYGSRVTHEISRSCFTRKRRSENYYTMYDLVIIINSNEKSSDLIVLEIAERLIISDVLANIIVHRLDAACRLIETGNFFLSWVFRSAIILYDHQNSIRRLEPLRNKNKCLKMYPETMYVVEQHFNSGTSHYTTAKRKYNSNNSKLAISLLRDAAISYCKCLIRAFLGFEMNINDLNRLINYTLNFTEDVFKIFPQNTKEEKYLFLLLEGKLSLNKGNHLRGNISNADMDILFDRVGKFKEVTARVLNNNGGWFNTSELTSSFLM